MTADTELISAAASVISALIAASALIFAGLQIRLQARTASFEIAAKFLDETRLRWADCEKARRHPDDFSDAVGELISSFEAYCVALNERMLSRRARLFISETILDYLDKMAGGGYSIYVGDWIGPKHVCRELKAFARDSRKHLSNSEAVLKMLHAEE